MQRTTSALTAAVLGAVLTASTAIAQQAPTSSDGPPTGSSTPKTPATASVEAADSQVYGMTVTRGARYLLRNGLDYLSYQQYDRALKFLRDAEARINDQKARGRTDQRGRKIPLELNAAELTALQRGIEAAQRGLRRASNAEAPYALSDKSRPGDGFTPATPATRLATHGYRTTTSAHNSKPMPSTPSSMLESDGDSGQARPVRLASGEIPASNQPTGSDPVARSAINNQQPVPGLGDAEGPVNTPEVPTIPMVSRLPDLTVVNSTEPLAAIDAQNSAKSQAAVRSGQAGPELDKTVVLQPQPLEEAPALISPPSASLAPQPTNINPAPAPASQAPVKLTVQDQAPGLPMSDGTATAVPGVTATAPVALANPVTATPDAELMKPAASSPPVESNTENPSINLETLPSSATDQVVAQSVSPAGAPHQEHSDPVPVSSSGTTLVAPATTTNTTVEPLVVPPTVNEELPVLPADLSRPAAAVSTTDAPKAQSPTAMTPVTPPLSDESLPPLPADLGRSASSTTDKATAPAPSTDVAQPPVVVPSVATAINQAAASEGQTAIQQPNDRPTTVQPTEGVTTQPNNEELPVLPAANTQQPVPNSVEPVAPVTSPTMSEPASAANLVAPATTPDTTTIERPQLGSAAVDSNPTTTAAIAPASPSTNTNVESLPLAAPIAHSETSPDVTSLPPALTGGTLSSGDGVFIPERRSSPSSLKPELQREVERIARRQEEAMQRQVQNPTQPPSSPRDTIASDLRTQTQMDISRAPSPAEARPIKAIPVPEDWVPLEPRNWSPQRKYWAAAATCHLPLYFQDPVLERYGHSVEQFVGPLGRFLTYPVDDPTQSTQRNQMVQPWFSAGLMGLQIIMWPYNLVMDPPWEAQYDLGYYRPGDNIPTDTYWLPLHGYGPPLRGSNY